MSKRDIYRAAKKHGLDIVRYDSGYALLGDAPEYWYEVTTQAPDGTEVIHDDGKQFVLEGIRKHGEMYRAALAQAGGESL